MKARSDPEGLTATTRLVLVGYETGCAGTAGQGKGGALSDKGVVFCGWGKRRWVFLFLLLSFSLFPIFLSGFRLGDLGFLFPLPYFFDRNMGI